MHLHPYGGTVYIVEVEVGLNCLNGGGFRGGDGFGIKLSFLFLFNPTTNKGTRSGHFQSFYFGRQLSKKFIRCLLGIVLYRELRQRRFKLSGTERLLNLRDLFACKFVAPFVLSMPCVPFEPMPFNFVF